MIDQTTYFYNTGEKSMDRNLSQSLSRKSLSLSIHIRIMLSNCAMDSNVLHVNFKCPAHEL